MVDDGVLLAVPSVGIPGLKVLQKLFIDLVFGSQRLQPPTLKCGRLRKWEFRPHVSTLPALSAPIFHSDRTAQVQSTALDCHY